MGLEQRDRVRWSYVRKQLATGGRRCVRRTSRSHKQEAGVRSVQSGQSQCGCERGGRTVDRAVRSRLENNLYKIWNRMSSGSYFPPPVRAVSIPKKNGGQRILGVPTVADRVAQMVVKQVIEPDVEPLFLPDFMAIGRESRRWMLLGSRASDAGNTTGFWSLTSRVCSTISTTR